MCDKYKLRYQGDEITLGRCDGCQTWGQAFNQSPCGVMYVPDRV
jgi:hypothetical protein